MWKPHLQNDDDDAKDVPLFYMASSHDISLKP